MVMDRAFPTLSDDHSGYLTDKLLVATHAVRDGFFDRSVIYLCAHNENGAMGLIINFPAQQVTLADVLDQINIPHGITLPDLPIHFGGPVDPNRGYILHSNDTVFEDTLTNAGAHISLSASIKVLEALVEGRGPKKAMLVLGCAGWGPGQLEAELGAGSWIIVPATHQLVFDTDDDHKWNLSAAALGVDLDRLSSTVGHA